MPSTYTSIRFNDTPCVDPASLFRECAAANPPIPVDRWFRRANRFQTTAGMFPGHGHLLMFRKDVKRLKYDTAYPLVFDSREQAGPVEFKNIRLIGTPINVSPGRPEDDEAVYLIQIADRRIDAVGLSNRRYNCRDNHNDADYTTASKNGGSAWTWTALVNDLAGDTGCVSINNAGELNLDTLDSTPEQIDARGYRSVDVLEDVLSNAGYYLWYDLVADDFFVRRVSDYDDNLTKDAERFRKELRVLWDDEPLIIGKGYRPKYARVHFPVWSPTDGADLTAFYVVDVANVLQDATTTEIAGSYCVIHDFMRCRVTGTSTVANSSDLVTRAGEVAAEYFRLLEAKQPFHFTLSGAHLTQSMKEGNGVCGLAWEDIGDGIKTHVLRTPRQALAAIVKPGSLTTYTSGNLSTGDFSQSWNRTGNSPTGVVKRAGGMTPSLERWYQALDFSDQDGPIGSNSPGYHQSSLRGAGRGPFIVRSGPMRWLDWMIEGPGGGGDREARPWRRIEREEGSGGAAGTGNLFKYVDADTYHNLGMFNVFGNGTPVISWQETDGSIAATPFFFPTCTIDKIAIYVGTVSDLAGQKCRVGIYESGADLLPDALLADFGEVPVGLGDPTGIVEIAASANLEENTLYWLAIRLGEPGGTPVSINCVKLNAGGTDIIFDSDKFIFGEDRSNVGPDVGNVRVGRFVDGLGALAALPDPFPGGGEFILGNGLSESAVNVCMPIAWVRLSA